MKNVFSLRIASLAALAIFCAAASVRAESEESAAAAAGTRFDGIQVQAGKNAQPDAAAVLVDAANGPAARPVSLTSPADEHKDSDSLNNISVIKDAHAGGHLVNSALGIFGAVKWYTQALTGDNTSSDGQFVAWLGLVTGVGIGVAALAGVASMAWNFSAAVSDAANGIF